MESQIYYCDQIHNWLLTAINFMPNASNLWPFVKSFSHDLGICGHTHVLTSHLSSVAFPLPMDDEFTYFHHPQVTQEVNRKTLHLDLLPPIYKSCYEAKSNRKIGFYFGLQIFRGPSARLKSIGVILLSPWCSFTHLDSNHLSYF